MSKPSQTVNFSLTTTFDLPYLTDWFAVTLRWVLFLGLSLLTVLTAQITTNLVAVIAFGAIWNVVNSTLVVFYKRFTLHRPINVGIDFLLGLATFWFAGDLMWPLSWSMLISLNSASLYFGLKGSTIFGTVLTAAQIALMAQTQPDSLSTRNLVIHLLGNLMFTLVMGITSYKILNHFRQIYQKQIRERKEILQTARKQERDRVKAFYSLAETLSTSLDLGTVLNSTLNLSAAALGDEKSPAARMVGAILIYRKARLYIRSGRHVLPADFQWTFPAAEGALYLAIHTNEPQHLHYPARDPELCLLSSLESCRSVLCLPMRSGLNNNGVMLFAHPDPDFFTTANRELLEMVSHHAAIAIQNARLYEDLADEKKRIIAAQKEATHKLATSLHDGPTQSVTNIAQHINIARRLLETNVTGSADELSRAEELARRTVQEIRHMLFTLRPLMLETEGLISALNNIAKNVREIYKQNIEMRIDPVVVEKLEPNTQTEIFYLVDEAVNNARKHARAEKIFVRLDYQPGDHDFAKLSIVDNGIGFNLEEIKKTYEKRGSLGMINLYERAGLINSILRIDTTPGGGTRVEITIPLTAAARLLIQHMPKQQLISAPAHGPSREESPPRPPVDMGETAPN